MFEGQEEAGVWVWNAEGEGRVEADEGGEVGRDLT